MERVWWLATATVRERDALDAVRQSILDIEDGGTLFTERQKDLTKWQQSDMSPAFSGLVGGCASIAVFRRLGLFTRGPKMMIILPAMPFYVLPYQFSAVADLVEMMREEKNGRFARQLQKTFRAASAVADSAVLDDIEGGKQLEKRVARECFKRRAGPKIAPQQSGPAQRAAPTMGQWEAGAASRLHRSRSSRNAMKEISFGILRQEAQEMTIQMWVFCSTKGLNYLYLGHLSKGRWGAAGARSQVQLDGLRVIGETVERRVRSALDEVELPYWPQELMKSRASYNLDEDCGALPLNFKEMEPGLPEAEDIGRLGVLEYVGANLMELLTKPEPPLLPEAEWPSTPPRAKGNVERVEDRWFNAARLDERGLLKPIAADRVIHAQGKRVTNGLFAVAKNGSPGPGAARVTRLIFNTVPTNAYLRPLVGDSATLVPSPAWVSASSQPNERLLWSGDDQTSAFFMYRIPEPWLAYTTAYTPVPSRILGTNAGEVWLAMTVLPRGWLYSVPIFQSIHRRVALPEESAGADLTPSRVWRRGRPVPAAVEAPLAGDGDRVWWSTYIGDFDTWEVLNWGAALPLVGTPVRLQELMRESYERNGTPVNKAIQRQVFVTRTGAEVDGVAGRAANSRVKNARLYSLTLWLLARINPVRALEFRRPLFGVFNAVWELVASGRAVLPRGCVDELARARLPLPLATANLRANAAGIVSCSGASEEEPRMLLVSLFDGIGGATVSLARAGEPDAYYDRWPGLIKLGPVEEIEARQL
ncbi:unnamed protein product [Prorocentrum cordatum]|uniref:Uncharacterized protein n=1 Tax=Prorocentrum cordatum TaxID=2364126 RepID=A0ABN9XFD1_9DINO|nr:unnamed protein product [Polarella glacialis]